MAIKCIVFDLDGTLVDTIGGIAHSCNVVLQSHNYPTHSVEAFKKLVGHGLRRAIYDGLPEEVKARIDISNPLITTYHDEVVNYYGDHYLYDSSIYEGIEALLDYIETHNITWCVHTNKSETIAFSIMEALFGNRRYSGVIGLSDTYPPKPQTEGTKALIQGFELDEVILVGDTEVDIQTAHNLNIASYSVSWGFRDRESLGIHQTILIDHPLELIPYLV